jgi:transcriptional regulator with GAF, ATPase, and Fis domain
MNMCRDIAPSRLIPSLGLRALLATALCLPFGDIVIAQPKPSPVPAEDQRILPFAKADHLIDIGGRHINLNCALRTRELSEAHQRLQRAFGEIQELKDQIQRENVVLREEVDSTSMYEEIVGADPLLWAVPSRVSKVAPADSTVLITGETGTGKELIARAIHKRSQRADRAFVGVNCAALPSALIASELFGHEKGAFTGAVQRRLGRFELAQGGTLFLDECGDLPLEIQIALLRVLQEREFERVGGSKTIQADVRLIAATNRDLNAAIAAGTFRSDLYYRLNVFPIEMPSLRLRKGDISILTEYFVQRYSVKLGRKVSSISKRTIQRFQEYGWPGNIRELQNVIERSLILCETDTFSVDESWLPLQSREIQTQLTPFANTEGTNEKMRIESMLTQTNGRISGPSGAAIQLHLPASTLESRIRALKIDKNRFKSPGAGI